MRDLVTDTNETYLETTGFLDYLFRYAPRVIIAYPQGVIGIKGALLFIVPMYRPLSTVYHCTDLQT